MRHLLHPTVGQNIYMRIPMKKEIDFLMILSIGIVLTFVESVQTLLSIFYKGIFINRKESLLKKTNKELRLMLKGHKRINNLKKIELVDLLLTAT